MNTFTRLYHYCFGGFIKYFLIEAEFFAPLLDLAGEPASFAVGVLASPCVFLGWESSRCSLVLAPRELSRDAGDGQRNAFRFPGDLPAAEYINQVRKSERGKNEIKYEEEKDKRKRKKSGGEE